MIHHPPVRAPFVGVAGVPSIDLLARLSPLYEPAQDSKYLFGSPRNPGRSIFETPAREWLALQVDANVAALEAIFAIYRGGISYAQDI